MSISTYTELYRYTESFLNKDLMELNEKFRSGVEKAMETLNKYFNRGSMSSFMAMFLDQRIKSKIYIDFRKETSSIWLTGTTSSIIRMNEYYEINNCGRVTTESIVEEPKSVDGIYFELN